jgi:hypothetical protein
MWAHVVVCSERVVEQKRLLFELFGRSIDEELICGISMIKEEVKNILILILILCLVRSKKRGHEGGQNCFTPNWGEDSFLPLLISTSPILLPLPSSFPPLFFTPTKQCLNKETQHNDDKGDC